MKISEFQALLKPVTDLVSSAAVDSALAEELDRRFPPGVMIRSMQSSAPVMKRLRLVGCAPTATREGPAGVA